MYSPLVLLPVAFIVSKSIKLNVGFFINMAIVAAIVGYLYYNNTTNEKRKKEIEETIIEDNIKLEHIAPETFNYVNKLTHYKKYNKKSISESIVYLNYFYGDMKEMNHSALIKANDNRKYAINTLISISLSIKEPAIENQYMTLVNAIKYKTEQDYKSTIEKYNKLEKYGPNDSPIHIDDPEPRDHFFNKNFSLV